MMYHGKIKNQLLAFYDGELTAAARQEVQSHIEDCLECRRSYAQWRKLAKIFFRAREVQPSEVFISQLMARIHAWNQPPAAKPWLVRIGWLVPAVGLAILALILIGPVHSPVSVETLLLADSWDGGSTHLVLASDASSNYEVLGAVMEGRP